MNLEYIKTLIESALHDLLNHDSMILNLKLKEECINHRFAIYIENIFKNTSNHEFLDRLSFDIEYNKSYFDEKEIIDEHDVRLRIRPDILIHERTTQHLNILAIEAKIGYPNKKDNRTINALLRYPFNYEYSCLVSYLPNQVYFRVKILQRNQPLTPSFKIYKEG